jgi:hypothetical protein
MDSERIPHGSLRGLMSELQQIDIFLAWKIPCTLVQGASIKGFYRPSCILYRAFCIQKFINLL